MRWLEYAAFFIVVLSRRSHSNYIWPGSAKAAPRSSTRVAAGRARALPNVRTEQKMTPRAYIGSFLLFGLCGMLAVFFL
jgi:hypothetical protein